MQQARIARHQPEPAARTPAALALSRPRLPPAWAIIPYLQKIDEARRYSDFGPLLNELEARLAGRFRRRTEVVTGANATQILTFVLQALRARPGQRVVLPSWTFVGTAHAVVQAGLVPWFADVDPETWALAPETADALRREEVAAVVVTAPYGRPLDLDAWRQFRDETGVPVIVDAAAGFDTASDARLPVVVSLHASQVLGAGEGGWLATEDEELAHRVRLTTNFGFDGGQAAQIPATNAKLSEYTAAAALASLDGWPGDRLRWMRAAQTLRMALIGAPEVTFQPGWGSDWISSACCIGAPDGAAERLAAALAARGVETGRGWGGGCHASPAFADCPRTALPVTERLAQATLRLPFAIDLTPPEAARIAQAVIEGLRA